MPNTYTLPQQKHILITMLTLEPSGDEVNTLLNTLKENIKSQQCDTKAKMYRLTNSALAVLEEHAQSKASAQIAVQKLKEKGLYEMVYAIPFHGRYVDEYTRAFQHKIIKFGFTGAKLAGFCVAAFLMCGLAFIILGAPYWLMAVSSGLFVGASFYIAGLSYGILNDMFAVRMNFPYFLLGHQKNQGSLFENDDKTLYAIGWGVLATSAPVAVAAVICTIVGTILAFQTPLAIMMMPILIVAMPVIALINELIVRLGFTKPEPVSTAVNILNGTEKNSYFTVRYDMGALDYQHVLALNDMCPTVASTQAWGQNSFRNLLGYFILPNICIISMLFLFKFSHAGLFLGSALSGSLASVIIPVVVVGMAAVFIGICGRYLKENMSSIDAKSHDRYHLEPRSAYSGPDKWELSLETPKMAHLAHEAMCSYPYTKEEIEKNNRRINACLGQTPQKTSDVTLGPMPSRNPCGEDNRSPNNQLPIALTVKERLHFISGNTADKRSPINHLTTALGVKQRLR